MAYSGGVHLVQTRAAGKGLAAAHYLHSPSDGTVHPVQLPADHNVLAVAPLPLGGSHVCIVATLGGVGDIQLHRVKKDGAVSFFATISHGVVGQTEIASLHSDVDGSVSAVLHDFGRGRQTYPTIGEWHSVTKKTHWGLNFHMAATVEIEEYQVEQQSDAITINRQVRVQVATANNADHDSMFFCKGQRATVVDETDEGFLVRFSNERENLAVFSQSELYAHRPGMPYRYIKSSHTDYPGCEMSQTKTRTRVLDDVHINGRMGTRLEMQTVEDGYQIKHVFDGVQQGNCYLKKGNKTPIAVVGSPVTVRLHDTFCCERRGEQASSPWPLDEIFKVGDVVELDDDTAAMLLDDGNDKRVSVTEVSESTVTIDVGEDFVVIAHGAQWGIARIVDSLEKMKSGEPDRSRMAARARHFGTFMTRWNEERVTFRAVEASARPRCWRRATHMARYALFDGRVFVMGDTRSRERTVLKTPEPREKKRGDIVAFEAWPRLSGIVATLLVYGIPSNDGGAAVRVCVSGEERNNADAEVACGKGRVLFLGMRPRESTWHMMLGAVDDPVSERYTFHEVTPRGNGVDVDVRRVDSTSGVTQGLTRCPGDLRCCYTEHGGVLTHWSVRAETTRSQPLQARVVCGPDAKLRVCVRKLPRVHVDVAFRGGAINGVPLTSFDPDLALVIERACQAMNVAKAISERKLAKSGGGVPPAYVNTMSEVPFARMTQVDLLDLVRTAAAGDAEFGAQLHPDPTLTQSVPNVTRQRPGVLLEGAKGDTDHQIRPVFPDVNDPGCFEKAEFVMEKLDGYRCRWDTSTRVFVIGKHQGIRVLVPPSFVMPTKNDIPEGVILEGELWAGRGMFAAVAAGVHNVLQWEKSFRFVVFDTPSVTGSWIDRRRYLEYALDWSACAKHCGLVRYRDVSALEAAVKAEWCHGFAGYVCGRNGEGIIVHTSIHGARDPGYYGSAVVYKSKVFMDVKCIALDEQDGSAPFPAAWAQKGGAEPVTLLVSGTTGARVHKDSVITVRTLRRSDYRKGKLVRIHSESDKARAKRSASAAAQGAKKSKA